MLTERQIDGIADLGIFPQLADRGAFGIVDKSAGDGKTVGKRPDGQSGAVQDLPVCHVGAVRGSKSLHAETDSQKLLFCVLVLLKKFFYSSL